MRIRRDEISQVLGKGTHLKFIQETCPVAPQKKRIGAFFLWLLVSYMTHEVSEYGMVLLLLW